MNDIKINNNLNDLNSSFAWWITGFADAESSFTINISKSIKSKLGWTVQPNLAIELHEKDLILLESIKSFFSVGTIRLRKKNNKIKSIIYSVRSLKELTHIIIPHFEKYPLLT